jgi:hypothetical protein
MTHRPRLWPQLAAALVITLAVSAAWGVVMAWSGYVATQIWRSDDTVYESIQVLDDGTPVIQSYSYQTFVDQSYRTLDGKSVEVTGREEWLIGSFFLKPVQSSGFIELPVPWSERLAASSNFQRPPVGWYLVRDDKPLGLAYLVGYDEVSKLRVGYIGRNGFRPTLPPRTEWFDVGRHRFRYWDGVVSSSGDLSFGGRAYSWVTAASDQRLPVWLLYVIDSERLLEIDLRARSVRTVLEAPGMLATAVVTQPLTTGEAQDAAQATPPATAESADAANSTDTRPRRDSPAQRLAVRMTDRIVILDPPSGTKREYVLPDSLRDRIIFAYVVGNNQFLVQWWKHRDGWTGDTELTWLQPDGTIAREEHIPLASPSQPSERQQAWIAAALAPVPIAWLFALVVVLPLGMLQTHQVATYADGLTDTFAIAWPPLVLVIVVGLLLGWWTYRIQRTYRRQATGAWCAFVLLLGVPGFIAYWLEHRRPKMETCTACGTLVPRDRDACASCARPYPAPPLVGTEIFA